MNFFYRFFWGIILIFGFSDAARSEERIVSLKPNITDIVIRLGAEQSLVGVTTYCALPPSLYGVARVSDYIKPNLEHVVTVRPTMIMTSKENSQSREIARLRELGFRIELVSFQSRDEIYASIRKIAAWLGRQAAGEALVVSLENRLAALRQRAQALVPAPRILWVVGQHPIVGVGGKSVFADFFSALALENPLQASILQYPQLSKEQVFSLNPDWIIDISTAEFNPHIMQFYQDAFADLPAMKHHQVAVLSAAQFLPGPPLWEGFEKALDLLSGAKERRP